MHLCIEDESNISPVSFSAPRVSVKDRGLLSQSQNIQESEISSAWVRHPPFVPNIREKVGDLI